MLQNDFILKMEQHNITIRIKQGDTFESIVAQLQPYFSNAILSVKNGESLLIFNNSKEIPQKLVPEVKGDISYYRSNQTKDIYAFFGEQPIMETTLQRDVTESILQGGMVYKSIHIIPDRAKIVERKILY